MESRRLFIATASDAETTVNFAEFLTSRSPVTGRHFCKTFSCFLIARFSCFLSGYIAVWLVNASVQTSSKWLGNLWINSSRSCNQKQLLFLAMYKHQLGSKVFFPSLSPSCCLISHIHTPAFSNCTTNKSATYFILYNQNRPTNT